jgi:hypothetical protein
LYVKVEVVQRLYASPTFNGERFAYVLHVHFNWNDLAYGIHAVASEQKERLGQEVPGALKR